MATNTVLYSVGRSIRYFHQVYGIEYCYLLQDFKEEIFPDWHPITWKGLESHIQQTAHLSVKLDGFEHEYEVIRDFESMRNTMYRHSRSFGLI